MSFATFGPSIKNLKARCQCCRIKTVPRGTKSCETCDGAGCAEGYAKFWKRAENCPLRCRTKKVAERTKVERTIETDPVVTE
jgi:hypothetical protein